MQSSQYHNSGLAGEERESEWDRSKQTGLVGTSSLLSCALKYEKPRRIWRLIEQNALSLTDNKIHGRCNYRHDDCRYCRLQVYEIVRRAKEGTPAHELVT